jgi:lysophospholipase L1-like esterase
MKDVYLLAAGVLTGLAVPTSALPQLSLLRSEAYRIASDIQVTQLVQLPANTEASPSPIASPENLVPEFSNQQTSVKTSPSFLNNSLNPNLNDNNTQPEIDRQPLSGKQLFYQRLAALQVGKIYTRQADEGPRSQFSGSKSKLSYQDWKGLLLLEARAMADGQGKNHLSIMVGDSLSMWFPKDKLPSGKLWLNQGISGDTSTGVLRRLSAFSKTRPDVIYVMAGINDLRQGTSDETILRNHRRIVRRLREDHPLTQIIVQSILPTRLPTVSNNRIRKINQQLAVISKEEGANYLNIHSWFTDFQGNLRQDLTTDGLHLSLNGYEVWQAAIGQIESKVTVSRLKHAKK